MDPIAYIRNFQAESQGYHEGITTVPRSPQKFYHIMALRKVDVSIMSHHELCSVILSAFSGLPRGGLT